MEIFDKICIVEKKLAKMIEEVSEFIFEHPELGNEEFVSSKYLVDKMHTLGFEVTYPYLDIPTAFRAELNNGEGAKVAFLAEYDALPGYGKDKSENAHACGHNWIAASTLGAAAVLAQIKEEFTGSIVLIGTPAEETTGGKCELVNRGAFQDIDAVFQMHLGAENNLHVVTLAMDSLEFNFSGVAAHAAAYPQNGVNALDAVQLMFAGVNALRQHMRSDARVAGIITEGGVACNIVPDKGSCRFYIRAKERSYLKELTQKIINCAKGAALMTGTEVSYHNFENSYDNLVYHEELRKRMRMNLELLGIHHFVNKDEEASGSSDIGNVSQVCPTVYCEIETGASPKVFAHEEDFLPYVHGKNAEFTLHTAVKAMAMTALEVLHDPKIVKEKAI